MKTNINIRTVMTVVFFLMSSYVAMALDPVMYLDKDGKQQWCTNYKIITGEESVLTRGWYVVSGDVLCNYKSCHSGLIEVRGNVHIILMDNSAFKYENSYGFVESEEEDVFFNYATLNLYSQSYGDNMGKIVMNMGNRYAFGTYNMNIFGGDIDITDTGGDCAFHCHELTIWNGKINIHQKQSISTNFLNLYGGEIHCDKSLRVHAGLKFGQSKSGLILDIGGCINLNDMFNFSGDAVIEDGVTVEVFGKTYTEKIPASDMKSRDIWSRDKTAILSAKTYDAVSVGDVFCTESKTSGWYTLNGIRLNDKPTSAGIYIHDGRKVIVK